MKSPQRFSREATVKAAFNLIHTSHPSSYLHLALNSFGLQWEAGKPPILPLSGHAKLWEEMENLGMVEVSPDSTPGWTKFAAQVFPELGFTAPQNVAKAIEESNGRITALPAPKAGADS